MNESESLTSDSGYEVLANKRYYVSSKELDLIKKEQQDRKLEEDQKRQIELDRMRRRDRLESLKTSVATIEEEEDNYDDYDDDEDYESASRSRMTKEEDWRSTMREATSRVRGNQKSKISDANIESVASWGGPTAQKHISSIRRQRMSRVDEDDAAEDIEKFKQRGISRDDLEMAVSLAMKRMAKNNKNDGLMRRYMAEELQHQMHREGFVRVDGKII